MAECGTPSDNGDDFDFMLVVTERSGRLEGVWGCGLRDLFEGLPSSFWRMATGGGERAQGEGWRARTVLCVAGAGLG